MSGRRIFSLVCIGTLLACGSVAAQEAESWLERIEDQVFAWPAYDVRRFQEDYAGVVLSRPWDERDIFDAIKHVPVVGEDIWMSFGGQARARMEGFQNFAFGAPAADDDGFYFLQRYMAHAELNLGENFRLFAEGKVALVEDRDLVGGRRTLDQDTLALQNGFAEVKVPFTDDGEGLVRVGRQELLFGKQRLISPLDWANSRRTFDGAVAALQLGDASVAGFYAKPVVVSKYDFNEPAEHVDLWGAYATFVDPFDIGTSFDAYMIAKHVHHQRGALGTDRYTLGGRAWGAIGQTGARYDLEGGAQVGQTATLDNEAWFLASQVTRGWKGLPWHPWMAVGFDISSGDEDPTDGSFGTFDQLAPLGHAYNGFIDIVGRQNIIDLHQSFKVTPIPKLWVKLDGHAFWRTDVRDALYNAGGGVVRRGAPGTSRWVGYELDLTAKYTLDHHSNLFGGYSHFFAGDFLQETGASDDIDFWYLQMQFTF